MWFGLSEAQPRYSMSAGSAARSAQNATVTGRGSRFDENMPMPS